MSLSPILNDPELDNGPNSEPISTQDVKFRPAPAWKRAIDLVGSIGLMFALSPVFAAIAIHIKLVSRGPIFFRQSRIGGGTRQFTIYKFRTMELGDSPCHREYVAKLVKSDQPASKPEYEARLIPGGRWLRRLSLDELPQLYNVMQGNMSLVGPRPDVLALEDYEPWQLRRFEVLPGISGLWQVSGKNSLTFQEMVNLDIEYIDRMSWQQDISIMVKTLGLVVSQDNE